MKRIKHLASALAVLLLPVISADAQNAQLDGLLLTASQFTPVDMMKYSQNNYSFTTGRVAAMGGAFTALGGDMASAGINPAGLGMYRTSVWSFSPAMTFTQNHEAYSTMTENHASRFGFNNIGTVLRLSQSSSGLTGFNLGLSYNKAEDFNYRGSVRLPAAAGGSLLNVFQLQLNGLYDFLDTGTWRGLSEKDLNNAPFNNGNIYIDEWGAVLGYQSGIFPGLGGDNMYGLNSLPEGSNNTPSLRYESRGSVSEYNIAGGFNSNNLLYLGFDFGFRDIYQKMSFYYTEAYEGNYSGTAQLYLQQMNYNQYLLMQGSAFNFKIGAIFRPVPQLRIGLAYHSPSYSSVRKKYYGSMGTAYYGNPQSKHYTSEIAGYDYSFNTPSRLLAGVALTLGDYLALSFDYERVWYNKMRYTSESYEIQESFRTAIAHDYRAADNFRAGIEVKPLPGFALRAGYAYYGSPVKEKDSEGNDLIFKNIFTTSSSHISAGVGIWLGRATTLDIAYVYSRYEIAPYGLYYYNGPARLPQGMVNEVTYKPVDDINGGALHRHTITATLNFLF